MLVKSRLGEFYGQGGVSIHNDKSLTCCLFCPDIPNSYTSCGDTGTKCGSEENIANNGTLSAGGGSGWAYPPYVIDLLSALSLESRHGGFDINSHTAAPVNLTAAALQAAVSEVTIVSINAFTREGSDRQNLTAWSQGDELIKAAASVNDNVVVVIHNPGPIIVEPWITHPNVTAVLMAYYPGQEAGSSLVPILFGEKSPTGRLPFVMGKDVNDWPDSGGIMSDYSQSPQVNFTEGTMIDYRWFEQQNKAIRYDFGHGLTYSTFKYGDLRVSYSYEADNTSIQTTNEKWDARFG